MNLPPELQALIAAAVAAGRVQRVPEGVRALPTPADPARQPKAIPATCGPGRLVSRCPRLDQYDRDHR